MTNIGSFRKGYSHDRRTGYSFPERAELARSGGAVKDEENGAAFVSSTTGIALVRSF
jgi:hypothetical protein